MSLALVVVVKNIKNVAVKINCLSLKVKAVTELTAFLIYGIRYSVNQMILTIVKIIPAPRLRVPE